MADQDLDPASSDSKIVWRTSDGTEPDLICEGCGRKTPMLVHGLGFDCCSKANGGSHE